jgi:hypothetical protein
MSITNFLSKILSKNGWYCIVGIKQGGGVKQLFVKTLEEVEEETSKLLSGEYNVYFGCAKYKTDKNRTKDNAEYFNAFWLDIDCGKTKDYKTQEEAIEALYNFCEVTNLPMPTLVNSGFGVHCYWCLESEISRTDWKFFAEHLKLLCANHGLKADSAVTADEARILRIPGTFNFKQNPPLEVSVIYEADSVNYTEITKALDIPPALPPPPSHIQRGLSPMMQKLKDNKQYSFSKIIQRIQEGNGCAQIERIITQQENIEEPLWRAGLSIARNCEDWEIAIHAMSDQYAGYDYDSTIKKADELLDKPYRCDKFEGLRPDGCKDCQFKGGIKSPIVLGVDVPKSEESEIAAEEDGQLALYPIPSIPFPYFRAKKGGIYREAKDEDPKLIYENDLFIIKRMSDRSRGELALARLHLPKDKPKEFVIPLATMNSKEELRKCLAAQGCICMPESLAGIMGYIVQCTKTRQHEECAEILRQQMGWMDDDENFVLGDKEISADVVRYSPPSETTISVAQWFHPYGDLAAWSEVANVYNRVGFEPHAFAFFTAFGAPLMKFTKYNGAFINLINKESGTGKTTILRMINSVMGHPHELLSKETDTLAHKMFRLGIHNNIAYTADELSNMKVENISTFLYSFTAGKGAGRMQSQVNMERRNDTTWSTIGVGSSNSSMVESLGAYKIAANGEIMRLLEYRINPTALLDKQQAYDIFEVKLMKNYGLAGPIFLQWVVKNKDEAIKLVHDIQKVIDERCNFLNKERYWSAIIACNIAGALIACRLNLIAYDIPRVIDWAVDDMVPSMQRSVAEQATSYSDFLGQFMISNTNNALIMKDGLDPATNLAYLPVSEPKNNLFIRIETDTKFAYISAKIFKEYCVQNKVICKDILQTLKDKGVFMGEFKKRLGKGTKHVAAPAVSTYKFYYDFDESMLENIADEDTHN